MAAVATLSLAVAVVLSGIARAETIPAQIFVLHSSWDVSRPADDAGAAPEGARPAAATSRAVLTVSGPGHVLAATTGSAESPPPATDAAGPRVFVPEVGVAGQALPFPGQLGILPAALHEELLFTPTSGGPAIALQLFLPAPAMPPDGSFAPFGDSADDDVLALLEPAGGRFEESITGTRLASLHQSYLAQIAPGGIESLHEARCAAAKRPRPAGCKEPSGADSEAGGVLAGLGLEAIPLPPAAVLLCTALACLAAAAWRRKVRAGYSSGSVVNRRG